MKFRKSAPKGVLHLHTIALNIACRMLAELTGGEHRQIRRAILAEASKIAADCPEIWAENCEGKKP